MVIGRLAKSVHEEKKEVKILAGNFNILLIGSDIMPGRKGLGERGDSLVLINTNTNEKVIRIITIPRDTYVSISKKGRYDKINHALAFGGWQLQKATVEEFLGIKIDKVIFLDLRNLKDVYYFIKKEFGNEPIKEILSKVGFRATAELAYDKISEFISSRSTAEAAIGRAKNHARIVNGCVELCIHYYSNPEKRSLFFKEENIINLLKLFRYTDLISEDVISLVNEWAGYEYSFKQHFVPGKPQRINNVSYWVPDSIPGSEEYFTKVVNYRKSVFV